MNKLKSFYKYSKLLQKKQCLLFGLYKTAKTGQDRKDPLDH